MSKPVVGAQLFTCREFTKTLPDIVKTFEKVAKAGYKYVQLSGFGPVDPRELAEVIDGSGLKATSTHTKWDRFLTELDAVIEEHKLWGCSHAVVPGLADEYHSEDGVKKFIDELVPVSEKLAAEGLGF